MAHRCNDKDLLNQTKEQLRKMQVRPTSRARLLWFCCSAASRSTASVDNTRTVCSLYESMNMRAGRCERMLNGLISSLGVHTNKQMSIEERELVSTWRSSLKALAKSVADEDDDLVLADEQILGLAKGVRFFLCSASNLSWKTLGTGRFAQVYRISTYTSEIRSRAVEAVDASTPIHLLKEEHLTDHSLRAISTIRRP